MFEKEAEEFTDSKKSFWRQGRTCIDSVRQAFQKGAEFGYNKANEWHYPSNGELPKEDCEVIILHENGKKNIQKWKNGGWTNAIVIPIIAWKEIIPPQDLEDLNADFSFEERMVRENQERRKDG